MDVSVVEGSTDNNKTQADLSNIQETASGVQFKKNPKLSLGSEVVLGLEKQDEKREQMKQIHSMIDPILLKKIFIKPIKEFIMRSSTISFIMSIITFIILTFLLLKYHSSDDGIDENSFRILSTVRRMFIFMLPVLLVLFDQKVLNYVKGLF